MTKITIDDLATMVAKGFTDNADRIGVLQNDMQTVKQDVGILKQDVGVLKQDVDILKQDVGGLKEDVSGLKLDVGGLKKDVHSFKEALSTLEEKTDSLANGQKRIIDILLNQTPSRAEMRELDHRVVRLEQHLQLA